MTKNFLKICLIILLALWQILFMPYLAVKGVWPNLILLTALILVLINLEKEAIFMAGIGGLILDLASPFLFGLHALLLIGAVISVRFLHKKFFNDPNILTIAFVLIAWVAIYDLIFFLLSGNFFGLSILINTIYSLLLSVIIYGVLRYFTKPSLIIKIKK